MNKTKKESFLLYKDFYHAVKHLNDETLGKLFRSLHEYQIEGIEPEKENPAYVPFMFYSNQFRVDDKKYQAIVERNQRNGAKGGRPKSETQETQTVKTKPKKADTVTGTVTGTDTGTGKETVKEKTKKIVLPFSSEKFSTAWELWKKYKKDQFKFSYRSAVTEQTALKKLAELSKGDQKTALLILEQSVGNGWAGIFELKEKTKQRGQAPGVDADYMNELNQRLNG